MAFGSWFKNLVQGASRILKKVAPVARKIIGGIQKVAPIIAPIIGGNAGKMISDAGKLAGRIDNGWSAVSKEISPVTADRFAVPMLKNS
ncbi:hypothetical protein M9Y10_030656 [Tritrichomonas musculus]|uniref:Uncharacterized protein n=1 Tax=Tritrichomonas musculus TaxID=1915356 RepID=A0ABR2H3H6_9EUKA